MRVGWCDFFPVKAENTDLGFTKQSTHLGPLSTTGRTMEVKRPGRKGRLDEVDEDRTDTDRA
jgi:hypothetical protein